MAIIYCRLDTVAGDNFAIDLTPAVQPQPPLTLENGRFAAGDVIIFDGADLRFRIYQCPLIAVRIYEIFTCMQSKLYQRCNKRSILRWIWHFMTFDHVYTVNVPTNDADFWNSRPKLGLKWSKLKIRFVPLTFSKSGLELTFISEILAPNCLDKKSIFLPRNLIIQLIIYCEYSIFLRIWPIVKQFMKKKQGVQLRNNRDLSNAIFDDKILRCLHKLVTVVDYFITRRILSIWRDSDNLNNCMYT